jgi:hypothetical protein
VTGVRPVVGELVTVVRQAWFMPLLIMAALAVSACGSAGATARVLDSAANLRDADSYRFGFVTHGRISDETFEITGTGASGPDGLHERFTVKARQQTFNSELVSNSSDVYMYRLTGGCLPAGWYWMGPTSLECFRVFPVENPESTAYGLVPTRGTPGDFFTTGSVGHETIDGVATEHIAVGVDLAGLLAVDPERGQRERLGGTV